MIFNELTHILTRYFFCVITVIKNMTIITKDDFEFTSMDWNAPSIVAVEIFDVVLIYRYNEILSH